MIRGCFLEAAWAEKCTLLSGNISLFWSLVVLFSKKTSLAKALSIKVNRALCRYKFRLVYFKLRLTLQKVTSCNITFLCQWNIYISFEVSSSSSSLPWLIGVPEISYVKQLSLNYNVKFLPSRREVPASFLCSTALQTLPLETSTAIISDRNCDLSLVFSLTNYAFLVFQR